MSLPPPGSVDLFRRQLPFELAPTVQLAHDLGDVHRVGCLSSLGFLLQLPQDDGAWARTQVTPHKWEAGAGRGHRIGGQQKATGLPSNDPILPVPEAGLKGQSLDLFPRSPGEPQVGLSEVGPTLVLFSALGAWDQSESQLPPDFRLGTRKTAWMVMIGHAYNL